MKSHPTLNERWVQNLIAGDPSILGLGDLELRGKERIQPRAGRLDLLLQDTETLRRYEVEIQLGATDEAHIIRTIEYWDIEKRRYPQYDHCAVIVAEDITSRFLNVISLFNGAMPIIAIQMQAIKVGDQQTVVFTKVIDELARGMVDEDEDADATPTDRAYWEKKSSRKSLAMVDKMFSEIRGFDASLKLKYNRFYIGVEKDGQPFNFVVFKPRRNGMNLEIKLPYSDDVEALIDSEGLDSLEYDKRWGLYRLRLIEDDLEGKHEALLKLARMAYDRKFND